MERPWNEFSSEMISNFSGLILCPCALIILMVRDFPSGPKVSSTNFWPSASPKAASV